jgi:hypothetical protein
LRDATVDSTRGIEDVAFALGLVRPTSNEESGPSIRPVGVEPRMREPVVSIVNSTVAETVSPIVGTNVAFA